MESTVSQPGMGQCRLESGEELEARFKLAPLCGGTELSAIARVSGRGRDRQDASGGTVVILVIGEEEVSHCSSRRAGGMASKRYGRGVYA